MKYSIKPSALLQPVPVILLCVSDGEAVNVTTLGDVAVAGLNPPLVYVSTNDGHFSTELIDRAGTFSVNVPGADMLDRVDYCGMVSGRDADKARLFSMEHTEGVPTLSECPISLVCETVSRTQVQQRVIYIASVQATLVQQDLLVDGKLDLSGLQAVYYGLDNRYYSGGDAIGKGYAEGKNI